MPDNWLSCQTSWQARQDLQLLSRRAADEWTGGMSGNAFVGDQVLVDDSFDTCRTPACQHGGHTSLELGTFGRWRVPWWCSGLAVTREPQVDAE